MSSRTVARGMLLFILSLSFRSVLGQVSYSIPEEMTEGSMVGNIAQDLGLDLKRLKSGKARIYTGDSAEYIELKKERGVLLIRERIDREALCEQTTPCAIHLQIILENPMEFFSVTVEINDVNDNSPVFKQTEMSFRISESAATGAVFALERAIDLDVGINGLQNYMLTPSNSFALNILNQADGNKLVEMILQKPLDREQQEHLSLVLTAVDGGDPQLSGTAQIHITVLDVNDNAPVFTQKIYKTSVTENAVKGTIILSVSATDMDHGSNSKITYFITNTLANVPQLFSVNGSNGDVRVNGNIDYEKARHYHIHVQARDDGGLTDSCKIELDVIDVNDNNPNINIMSQLASIVENSSSGTVVTMMNVQDPDSAENGKINCFADENIPFSLTPTTVNFFSIVTNGDLDRERDSEYNISVTCSDEGTPSLSSSVTLSLLISDVNDNAPVFEKSLYEASVQENNAPSHSICTVRARDADFRQNARVSYMLEESSVNGAPVSSIVSIGADSGVIHAIKSFDFEQIKVFEIHVKAQDGGSPPLSSNISVQITILDQNDNAPQILYPVQSGASVVAEIVPRSADVGYLVTKVVAVDVDSGQNAWLSYKLQKATDRALFEVGAQNGEIRTVRQVTDKDAVKQRLSVVVEDNGQPPRSATVNVNVALADSFPELLSEFSDFTLQEKEHNDNLTFYLVLALAVVSFLFIVSIIAILSVKCYRWRRERMFSKSGANLPVIPYFPPLYADVEGTGTLQHVYNYEVCRTADSRKSDHTFKPYSESVISLGTGGTQTLRHTQNDTMKRDDFINQKPPSSDWRFPPNQRPGPSGAAATPEVAVGTGPWPNPPTEAEQLQALMAAANEVSEATNTLTPGTMGLSTRYNPQFTLQHVPDYRQNVYIPGSTATLTPGQQQAPPTLLQQAPPPMQASAQPEPPKAQTPASKKKSTKKDKK